MKSLFTHILILISLTCFSQTQKDVEVIDVINMVRTNPKSFIPYVEDYLNQMFVSNKAKQESIDLVKELKTMKPLDELVFNKDMYKFSYNWASHLKDIQKFGHNTEDNFAENLVGGCVLNNPYYIVISLLIDVGFNNKEHRKNILNPNYKYISVSTNDFVCVQNFR